MSVNNYTARPPTFSGDSIEFEWWKSKTYILIIDLDDEFWVILEDGIGIIINGVGMVYDTKALTPTQKRFRKHHRVRGILVDALPHSKYIKIIDKSTANTIFNSLCVTYEGNQQVQEAKANLLAQHYELFKMKEDGDIETMFSRFQVLVFGLQVLNKSYTMSDHVKKIIRSLPIRYKPKMTVIQKAKDLNTLTLKSLISNLQSHEMELNRDEAVRKLKPLDFKSVSKTTKAPQNLARKNKRFSSESSGFRGSGFREKKDDHKVFFNCKKPSHFIIECPGLQKDKPKKGSFHKDNFKNRFKKSLMKTWDELDNEEDTENCEEKVNLALMALTSSEAEPESDFGSKSEEEDKVFSKLSRFNLINFVQELMGSCQEKAIHMKIQKKKKQYELLKDELKFVQNKKEALEKDRIGLVKEMSNKPLDECELALKEFLINGFNRNKIASIIYGVSISKGEGLG
ncbi:uncharacterized protein LOC127095267 [Lathyrus oleraceus]|uniref:uncharacterized protein LOC127095267 n=1 Tax=Pisum sativum TaxID=3888 RepID=UPI0021D3254F|nr:uncharacterized protein LOC127095267 [Pisum sativum]